MYHSGELFKKVAIHCIKYFPEDISLTKMLLIIALSFFFIAISFLFICILKFAWGWIIPDIFPGAVSQGLIIASLSWHTAFKFGVIALLYFSFSIIASIAHLLKN
jgi:hypothetical protein